MTSEIRANTIKNRVGLGTVSFTNTGPVVSGIVTANTIRLTDDNKIQLGDAQDLEIVHDSANGVIRSVNSGGNMHVESKNHIELNVNYNTSSGSKENALKAIANAGVSLFFNGAQKLQTTNTGATVTGTLVATTFDGNLTGNVTGNIGGGTVAGSTGTFSGDVSIADKILHTDDTNTSIRFPSDDTFTVETAGTEKLRITSDGKIGINNSSPTKELTVSGNAGAGIMIESSGTTNGGVLDLRNTQGSNQTYRLAVGGGDNAYVLGRGFFIRDENNSATRLVINTNGRVGINELNPQQTLHVHNDTAYQGILINGNGAPRIAFARNTTTTGEWSAGIDGTNGDYFVINNSNDNSNRLFIMQSNKITCGANTQINGNLIMASAGNGIDFSATANGGSGTPSELLDDYEEGYFAPEVTNLSSGYGSGTFYNRQARYTKVGNMVNCWVHLQWWANAVTSGNDNLELTITGFPFEVDGVGYSGCCGGGLQAQSWRFSGSGFNNYATGSDNVQPRINSAEQIRFGVFAHNSITGQVTQKSINGYSPNIEFFFSVRVTSYK